MNEPKKLTNTVRFRAFIRRLNLFCACLIITLPCFAFLSRADGASRRLLTCNYNDTSVEMFDRTGAFVKVFVAPGSGGLDQPQDLATGCDGNLYVTSWGTSSVKRYDGRTGAYIDDFIPSGSGGLQNPDQLIFRLDGKLYVSSRFAATIGRYMQR